jgi:hypothetical protein
MGAAASVTGSVDGNRRTLEGVALSSDDGVPLECWAVTRADLPHRNGTHVAVSALGTSRPPRLTRDTEHPHTNR